MSRRWWTSDLHFGHSNVIEYCKRPYRSVSEMDRDLIERWNRVVSPKDYVVFLGDWCLHQRYFATMAQLNFAHLFFVAGNHDRTNHLGNMLATDPDMMHLVDKVTIYDHLVVEIGDREFYAVHRPIRAIDSMPTLCGHVHEKWMFLPPGTEIGEHSRHEDKVTKKLTQPVLNVGCDQHNYTPISDEQILEFFDEYYNRPKVKGS